MKEYRVLSPIQHNNKAYEVGEAIELDDKHAKSLLTYGSIAKPQSETKPIDKKK